MSLDSWAASDAVVKDRHLHHGRFGLRWKSSDAAITGNCATRHLTLAVDCDVTIRTRCTAAVSQRGFSVQLVPCTNVHMVPSV